MSKRLRRILLRILIPLVVVVGVLLAAFTWFAFWPLEGSVDSMVSLVPADVDFVYRSSWPGLKDTGWIQENVEKHPFVPQIAELMRQVDIQTIELETMEAQINAQIPLGITTFSLEKDVMGGEVIAAGRFCEGWDPAKGPPTWRELLLLTRITWKPKFVSALKHGFVRDRLGPNLTVTEEEDGIFKIVLHTIRPTSVADRSVCGEAVMPPQNVWYMTRVKDVLAVGNALNLVQQVALLSRGGDEGHSYLDRPWVTLEAPPGSIAASIDLQPLRNYLMRAMELAGRPFTVLRRYLTIPALDRMNGRLSLPSRDLLQVSGDIRYQSSNLSDGVREVYDLQPEELGASVAALVPAEDTFGVFLLRTPPYHLIDTIYNEILSDGDRRLWQENFQRMNSDYRDIEQLFREFADRLGDTAGVAVGRLSDVYDTKALPKFFPDASEYPDANWPALAILIHLKQGVRLEELDDYFEKRVPLLGGKAEVEKKQYRGLTYRRIHLEVKPGDYATVDPAYILAQDHFIFSSNESYFRKILDTMVDPKGHPPLSTDQTFQATMTRLPERSHLVLFLDLAKLYAVPSEVDAVEGPKGYMWDRRSIWLAQEKNPRNEAVRYRTELQAAYTKSHGRPATGPDAAEIEQRVDQHWDTWLGRFREFEEEYRQDLLGYRRLRSIGLSIRAEKPRLFVDFALLLNPVDQSP